MKKLQAKLYFYLDILFSSHWDQLPLWGSFVCMTVLTQETCAEHCCGHTREHSDCPRKATLSAYVPRGDCRPGVVPSPQLGPGSSGEDSKPCYHWHELLDWAFSGLSNCIYLQENGPYLPLQLWLWCYLQGALTATNTFFLWTAKKAALRPIFLPLSEGFICQDYFVNWRVDHKLPLPCPAQTPHCLPLLLERQLW